MHNEKIKPQYIKVFSTLYSYKRLLYKILKYNSL